MKKPTVANFVVLLYFIFFQNIEGWRSFAINLTNSSCVVFTNKTDLNVTINNNSMNMYFTVKEQITNPLARIEIILQSPDTGRYEMEVLNRTIDTCKLLRNRLYEPLIQIIYGIMLEYGNFPRSCPLKMNQYYIENMAVDPERFPPYLPERNGYAKMTVLSKEKNLTTALAEQIVFFQVKNSALNRFKAINKN